MTVKQETLIYQPYYDLAKDGITMLSVIRGVRLRFKFFGSPRQARRIALRTQKTSVRGNTEEKRSMCCSCRLGKVRSIISFPTHLKGENQMRVYSSFGVLLQAVI